MTRVGPSPFAGKNVKHVGALIAVLVEVQLKREVVATVSRDPHEPVAGRLDGPIVGLCDRPDPLLRIIKRRFESREVETHPLAAPASVRVLRLRVALSNLQPDNLAVRGHVHRPRHAPGPANDRERLVQFLKRKKGHFVVIAACDCEMRQRRVERECFRAAGVRNLLRFRFRILDWVVVEPDFVVADREELRCAAGPHRSDHADRELSRLWVERDAPSHLVFRQFELDRLTQIRAYAEARTPPRW